MIWFKKKPLYAKQIAIEAPKAKPDRFGIAIATVVRDEASYIEEWLRFHKAVGIRHFIIYDDGSTDGTADVARAVLSEGELTIVPWFGRMTDVSTTQLLNHQLMAFCHAILNYGPDYRWMAFIDVDEFLLPKTATTVEQALAHAGGFPNVSLPWHMFGTSGHKTRPAGSVLENYTIRGADPLSTKENASNFKCIVDPSEVTKVSVHHFETRSFGSETCNDLGQRFSLKGRKSPSFYSATHLQLNHYYTRSEEELAAKISRGAGTSTSRQRYERRIRTAVQNIEAEVVEDRAMLEFLAKTGLSRKG